MMQPSPARVVPVLLWHAIGDSADQDLFRVTRAAFRRHLDLVVASGRVPLTAAEYGVMLTTGTTPDGAVLLTFDDGFADLVDEVLPALRARSLRATAFITSGFVGRSRMLSRAGLSELVGGDPHRAVEIGAHSITHPHLDVLGAREAEREIAGSGRDLEDWLGQPVTSFAYPHGSHSRRTRALAVQCGYRTVHAVRNALSHPDDDVYAVSRFTVRADTSDERVEAVLACRAAPLGWSRERVRTWGFRQVRRGRLLAGGRW